MNEQLHFEQLLDTRTDQPDPRQFPPEQHRATVGLLAELMRRIVSPDQQGLSQDRGEGVAEGPGDE